MSSSSASLSGIAGAGGKGGNFVESIIRVGREKGALRVVEDQTMSPTATADVAWVVMQIFADSCAPGIYHVVNSGAATWFEFAREIIRRTGVEATVTPCTTGEYPVRAARPRARQHERLEPPSIAMPPWRDGLDRYPRAKGYWDA